MSAIQDMHLRASLTRGASLRDALHRLQASSTAIVLVLDEASRLVGSLSDGDARRAFLAGADLDGPVDPWMHASPVTVPAGTDRAAVLDLMRARDVPQIPEVDSEGRVVRLHLLKQIVGTAPVEASAVILAGGRGTRLRSVNGDLPKPMVPVAGRPILERLVLHLVGSGVQEIVLAVGFRSEVIRDHFGDGGAYGCSIQYVVEEVPLGTAGPLGMLRSLEGFDSSGSSPLIVMNGDLITSFSVSDLLEAHRLSAAALTIATTEYAHEVPFGVVETSGTRVTGVLEKPTWRGVVNAGIYTMERQLLGRIPTRSEVLMTDFISDCVDSGVPVHTWRISGAWHDVGRPQDLASARGL